jgi:glutamate mutase epsilon subunit
VNGAVRVTEKNVWDVRVFVHIRNARADARVRCDVSTLSGIVVSEGRSFWSAYRRD